MPSKTYENLLLQEHCIRLLSANIANSDDCGSEEDLEYNKGLLMGVEEVLREMTLQPRFRRYLWSNPNDAVLCHGNLHSRNIIVEHTGPSEDDWHVSGIVGWDAVGALPRVLAREAPAVLWYFDLGQYTDVASTRDSDFLHLPCKYRDKFDEPHGAAVQAHFDDHMQKKLHAVPGAASQWLEDTYGAGKWLRRVTDFCNLGFNGRAEKVRAALELIQEWEEADEFVKVADEKEDLAHDKATARTRRSCYGFVAFMFAGFLFNAMNYVFPKNPYLWIGLSLAADFISFMIGFGVL